MELRVSCVYQRCQVGRSKKQPVWRLDESRYSEASMASLLHSSHKAAQHSLPFEGHLFRFFFVFYIQTNRKLKKIELHDYLRAQRYFGCKLPFRHVLCVLSRLLLFKCVDLSVRPPLAVISASLNQSWSHVRLRSIKRLHKISSKDEVRQDRSDAYNTFIILFVLKLWSRSCDSSWYK